jgi:hypothetical protein
VYYIRFIGMFGLLVRYIRRLLTVLYVASLCVPVQSYFSLIFLAYDVMDSSATLEK